MFIDNAKRLAAGTEVSDLDVVVTTAGKTKQVDESLPLKQSKQDWEQALGLTDTSGHIWAIWPSKSYKPIVKGLNIIIKTAKVDSFITKFEQEEKRLIIGTFTEVSGGSEPPPPKEKFEGILDPMIENILAKYDISAIDALWPLKRKNKKTGVVTTQWIIYHRYCEQIAARAGIVFEKPEVVVNDRENNEAVILVTGRMGHTVEWSFGEASPKTVAVVPYIWAMAEKRGKDRVILKLAGFHGMLYSDAEEEWKNNK